jgi:hypothetical protein
MLTLCSHVIITYWSAGVSFSFLMGRRFAVYGYNTMAQVYLDVPARGAGLFFEPWTTVRDIIYFGIGIKHTQLTKYRTTLN